MNSRIAIVAALPREIEPLVRNWPARITSRRDGSMICECDRAIAVCAGMGRERVAHALALAETRGPVHSVISLGYAGALRAGIARNKIFWPRMVVDAATAERFDCEVGSGTLVTVDQVLGLKEKPQVAERWNADLVDMEAASVARVCQLRGMPFRTLKVVSDEAGDVLPDFNRFIDARGGFREAAFAWYLALHPGMIPNAIRMERHTVQASETMARAMSEVLEKGGITWQM